MEGTDELYLLHMWARAAILLDVPLRLHDLLGLHGGKFLGHVVQRDCMDMS